MLGSNLIVNSDINPADIEFKKKKKLLLHKIYSIHESNNIHTYNKHSKNKKHYNNGLL